MEEASFFEKHGKLISGIVQLIFFIICMVLLVKGHSYGRLHADVQGGIKAVIVMLIGLTGILGLLYFYNKKFK